MPCCKCLLLKSMLTCPGEIEIWPRGFATFSCSTLLRLKFIKLINVKTPTIVGISTLISMINTPSESLKARKVLIFQHCSFFEQLS